MSESAGKSSWVRWGSLQNDILGSREHCHTRDVLGVQAPVRVYLWHHRFQARYWPHDHFKTDPREREREPPTPTTLQNPPEANPFLSPHEKNQNQEHPKLNLKPGDSKMRDEEAKSPKKQKKPEPKNTQTTTRHREIAMGRERMEERE